MDSDLVKSRKMAVLFGSQTGSAEDAARRIGRDGVRRRLNPVVCSLDDYNIAQLVDEPLVVFVVATTGQGDPPDNMKKFWRFIWRKNLLPGCLANLRFAILGFGDSSYQKFNFIAKKLRKRLVQLGGMEVLPAGFADDQHDLGLEAFVGPWIRHLQAKLLQLLPAPDGVEFLPDGALLPPTYEATFSAEIPVTVNGPATENTALVKTKTRNGPVTEQQPFYATLTDNKRVTANDHWQDVRLVTLDITDSGLRYSAGDVCHVQPKNMPDTVKEFIEILALEPAAIVTLRSTGHDDVPCRLKGPHTVQDLVESYFDINSIPRRYFWELMGHFTDSDLEKSKFQEFCSPEGQEDLLSYCNRPKRTLLEVMKDFPGAASHIPFDYLFDMIPPLRPRAFSIASSQLVCPNEMQLLVAVVKYRTNLAAPRRGVCSNYLANLIPSSQLPVRVPIWIRKGVIEFPVSANVPVIMVGPGTGCAPFRAYVQQRAAEDVTVLGRNVLFFGCRNCKKDFYFEDEWRHLELCQFLQLFVAFSRDQPEKVYVQHLLAQQSALVWDLIEKHEAHFFIAGNSKNMPDSVRQELRGVIVKEGKRSEDEADIYLDELDRKRRYQLETWS